jgi:hypothetical protein
VIVLRKLYIGLISFVAVLGAFFLYSQIGRTPPLKTGAGTGAGGAADSNFAEFADANQIGKIGDIGIGLSKKARYMTRNEKGEIDGEFGFEVLVHKQDNLLELEKPYRNIYRSGFTCYMTADTGTVEIENAAGGLSPKDATFSGNVLIHIIPGSSGDIRETKIYLENLVFLSDRSRLATEGPVRVISENFRMTGTGMELIYNEVLNRLELFRIFDLDSLLVKQPKTVLTERQQTRRASKTDSEDLAKEPVDIAVTEDVSKTEPEQQQYYKCRFGKNVCIDTQEELIYAVREVFINDIFWPKASEETTPDANIPSDTNEPDVVAVQTVVPDESVRAVTDSNEPSEQLVEIKVTCDGGFMIVPRENSIEPEESSPSAQEAESDRRADMLDQAQERTSLMTDRIDYSMLTGDTLAAGPSELTFYIKDSNAVDPNQQMVPVKVTAQKQVRFLKAANQVIFEGDCLCTMPQKDLTIEKDLTLSAPELIIDLPVNSFEQKTKFPDMTTLGPTKLVFYVEDTNAIEPDKTVLPVTITAQKQARFLSAANQVVFEGDCLCQMGSEEISRQQSFQLKSPMLTINTPREKTGQSFALTDIVAAGPAELDFYVDDITGKQGPNEPLPAKVFAQKQARFLSSSRQVVFDGPCRSTITRRAPNFIDEFTLLSEKMTVDLPADTNDRSATSLGSIKHLAAEGGIVTLAAVKKPGLLTQQALGIESEEVLSGIKINCRRINYDSQKQVFAATGPAEVWLSNTKISDVNEQVAPGGPGKQWVAFVENCHDLQYSPAENRIIADAESDKTLNIEYVTVENGQYGPVVLASAGHTDIVLMETPEGKTDLSTLVATRGISYTTDKGDLFLGSELFFDHEKSLITVTGDETQPCYYNGSLVDQIKYNLETREVEAKIVAPGMTQIKKK